MEQGLKSKTKHTCTLIGIALVLPLVMVLISAATLLSALMSALARQLEWEPSQGITSQSRFAGNVTPIRRPNPDTDGGSRTS